MKEKMTCAVRRYSKADRVVAELDKLLKTALQVGAAATRRSPAESLTEGRMSDTERREAARLMRVNHTGEVCAQALYMGQALTARDPDIKQSLAQSAADEVDHLVWCRQRIDRLSGRPSYLNAGWFLGSISVGAIAGLAGDRYNLGFLAETERQVVRHLDGHLARLPAADTATRAVLAAMRDDEQRHAETALSKGAGELPGPVKRLMEAQSKVMTTVTYWM